MTLMKKLTLNFCRSQTYGPVKVRVLELVPPPGPVASGCGPGNVVTLTLSHTAMSSHGMMPSEYAWAPPHAHWCSGALFPWAPIITVKPK